jgi:Na+-transporting NADH:ubiquinone oxidoreductase subunit NqrC
MNEDDNEESPWGIVLAVLYVGLIVAATVLTTASMILGEMVEQPSASHTLKSAYDIVGMAGLIVGIICIAVWIVV